MPLIFKADFFTSEQYEEMYTFLQKIRAFVMGSEGPPKQMIDSADEAFPKEDWEAPILLDGWRFRTPPEERPPKRNR